MKMQEVPRYIEGRVIQSFAYESATFCSPAKLDCQTGEVTVDEVNNLFSDDIDLIDHDMGLQHFRFECLIDGNEYEFTLNANMEEGYFEVDSESCGEFERFQLHYNLKTTLVHKPIQKKSKL